MSQITSSEKLLIERFPLGDSISPALDALRRVEEESAEDPEACDSNTNPGWMQQYLAAVGKLLQVLCLAPVSSELASRTERDYIRVDLYLIHGRLRKDLPELNHFRSFTQRVTRQASDIEIWEAVVDLIQTIHPATPAKSLFPWVDTPFTHSSAREKLELRVFTEIRHCTYRAVEGFHEKYFKERPWSERAEEVYTASQHYYDNDKKRWELKGVTEHAVCDWLLRFQDELLDEDKASYFWSSENSLVGRKAQRPLDIFVKAKSAPRKHRWEDVLAVGELKKANKKDKSLWLQLGSTVWNVFDHQPRRRFVHAFTLTGTQMETWVFDRSGPFSGTAFDIHKEPEKFIEVLCGYLMMSDEELGIDTFTARENNKVFVTLPETGGGNRKFELKPKPIALPRAIVSRGTSCYLAKIAGTDEYDTVMKFSWTSSLRNREADLLIKASERGVKGIARIVGFQEEITSIRNLRTSLTFPKPHKLQPPRKLSSSQSNSLSIGSDASRKRPSSDSANHFRKRSRLSTQLAGNCDDGPTTSAVPKGEGTSLNEDPKQPFVNRVFRAIAISPAGRCISQFTSVLELIGSLRDAITAHRSLLKDGKILHRDISENNIIITDPEKADGFRGMLIDLDLAKEEGQGPSGAQCPTGTLAFMAIGVLRKERHTYRHDLESFFYVLLWLIIRRGWALTKEKPTGPSVLSRWYTGTSYEEIAKYKRVDMFRDDLEGLLREFPPLFNVVKPLCRELRGILFPPLWGDIFLGTPEKDLYEPIIKAFDDSLNMLRVFHSQYSVHYKFPGQMFAK